MKDKLEKFITDNREEFDFMEPSDAVWNRIQENLGQQKPKKISLSWKKVAINVAAACVLFMTSYLTLEYVYYKKSGGIPAKVADADMKIPQLIEAEVYYTRKVNNKLEEVSGLLKEYPDIAEDLKQEFSELDSLNKDLKGDLKDNVANKEIVESMIQNYRIKLNILESLLVELKDKNEQYQKKNNDYEL